MCQAVEHGLAYGYPTGMILENGVPYAYLFEPTPDVLWLSATPISGTVAPGGSMSINVSVDSTGLAPGLYRARLVLDTNDPRNPRIQVPITLVVTTYQSGVNAGGKAYTDTMGDRWVVDQAYTTGGFGYTNKRSRTASTNVDIAGTADDPLYQTLRTDPGEYRFDGLAPGVYQVDLKFAELKQSNTGTRLTDVIIEGALVLPAHDIVLDAGSKAADDHSFFVAVTDGQMNVRFVGRRGYAPPIINALRVTLRPDR
jgi:hypothetical protein